MITCKKKGFGGGVSTASPMIKSAKGRRRERRELGRRRERRGGGGGGGVGSLCFIFEFLLDFRKYNLVILVIRFIFPYQGLVRSYRGLMFLRRMRFGH